MHMTSNVSTLFYIVFSRSCFTTSRAMLAVLLPGKNVVRRRTASSSIIIIISFAFWLLVSWDSVWLLDGGNVVHTAQAAAFIPRDPKFHTLLHRCYQSRKMMIPQKSSVDDDQAQQQQQQQQQEKRTIVDRSTLILLEHINLNVPTQDLILPFYYQILGCGMDPRKVENLSPNAPKKTLWANAGATQFHLPYGDIAQCIPGQIGLRYDSLQHLKQRIQQYPNAYQSSIVLENGNCIRLVDHYNNVFYCRTGGSRISSDWKQPILSQRHDDDDDHDNVPAWKKEAMVIYGRRDNDATTDCRGIDYIEFNCPMGTAEKIALFYNSVFDATTFCMETATTTTTENNDDDKEKNKVMVAIIAIGKIDDQGRADQTLLFRETIDTIPAYDGHHIAMYIGTSEADFEQAFSNAQLINIIWINPRFNDQALTLTSAKQWKQFRFKNIIDMTTGEIILELEHEMRSIHHDAWPGPRPMIPDY